MSELKKRLNKIERVQQDVDESDEGGGSIGGATAASKFLHGIKDFAKKNKLGSKLLGELAKSVPEYAPEIKAAQSVVKSTGYGRRGRTIRGRSSRERDDSEESRGSTRSTRSTRSNRSTRSRGSGSIGGRRHRVRTPRRVRTPHRSRGGSSEQEANHSKRFLLKKYLENEEGLSSKEAQEIAKKETKRKPSAWLKFRKDNFANILDDVKHSHPSWDHRKAFAEASKICGEEYSGKKKR